MVAITPIQLSDIVGGDPRKAKELKITGKEVTELPDLGYMHVSARTDPLTYCRSNILSQSLTRLDLSSNKLPELEALQHLHQLTWLNVRENQLASLQPLSRLTALKMLNAGFSTHHFFSWVKHSFIAGNNILGSMRDVHTLTGLCALILNHNRIGALDGLKKLTNLNTLVLSHNRSQNARLSRFYFHRLAGLRKSSPSHFCPASASCRFLTTFCARFRFERVPSLEVDLTDLVGGFYALHSGVAPQQ